MADIATAYVRIVPSLKGAGKEISRQLGGSESRRAARGGGAVIGGAVATGIKAVGKATMLGAGLAVGAALTGGINRAVQIENAEAKLTGLGHSADGVAKIMENALAAVSGTAFGMGEAASVAATIVAAGVKPGKDLERTLTLVGDAATIAGTDMNSMGAIFAKVATSNKLQLDTVNQLHDAGIPVLQLVAEEMGVTAEEASKMATAGKVDFATFSAAMSEGMGGAAQESGKTAQGAFKNTMAALSRLGESVISGVFPKVAPALAVVIEKLDGLGPSAEKIGQVVGDSLSSFASFVSDTLIPAISSMIGWIRQNSEVFLALGVGAGVASAAFGVYQTVLFAMKIPMLAATAAQWALNAALAANPIGLVVVAIAALVAGLVYLYRNNETVRMVIDAAWAGIKTAIGATVDWITNVAWPAMQTAFTAIGDAARWVYENVLKPVWDGIKNTVETTWFVLKIIFVTIATAFSLMWQFMKALWSKTGAPLFRDIRMVASAVWDWLRQYVFAPIQLGFKLLLLGMKALKERVLDPMWNGIKKGASAVWNWLRTYVFAPIKLGFQVMGTVMRQVFENTIRPVWNGIKNAASSAWNWIRDRAIGPLKSGIRAIGDAFKPVATIISKAWDKIKAATARPINFVINTVYTKGIKKTWDRIADSVGLDLRLPSVSPVKFATGGVLPGYTPGRDVHEFYSPTGGRLSLSGGEAIMRPEFTKAVGGPAGVAALNAKARSGQAFANGGVFDFFGDAFNKVKDLGSSFLSGPGDLIKKLISGPMGSALGKIGGGKIGQIAGQLPKKIVGGLIDKAKDFASSMFGGDTALKGGGKFGGGPVLGWENMWNIVKNAFPGASLNSAMRPGAITAVGTKSMHGLGRAIDVTPSMDIFNWLAKTFPNSNELIYSPAGGRQLYQGRKMQFGEPTRGDHWDHVHWSMANGGVLPNLYDNGGWLPSGGVGVNRTGKPEAVLTPSESAALKSGLNQNPVNLTFNTTRVTTRDVVHALNMVDLLEV